MADAMDAASAVAGKGDGGGQPEKKWVVYGAMEVIYLHIHISQSTVKCDL